VNIYDIEQQGAFQSGSNST